MPDFAAQIDVRKYAPQEKHPAIFTTFENLKPGETMELINDHDPRPLRYQFMAELPDKFLIGSILRKAPKFGGWLFRNNLIKMMMKKRNNSFK